ncbi:MAG: hypothetical protein A2W31_10035 [Planctomycetes bacterium RBG_16_64_10]|nr:MAG: hypothetical protein A2W31_10035 [Planctomycetes bacterium RBG_16_64_10]
MQRSRRIGSLALLFVGLDAVLLTCGSQPARAGYRVELGPSDGLALDQPRVAIEVFDVSNSGVPSSLGPGLYNTLLLDTASNSIIVVGGAVTELAGAGYQTVAIYDEQGVAGFTPMGVSRPYAFDFAGSSGIRHRLSDVRLLSNGQLNFGSFNGIVGMPAMVGRTTTMDMTVWSGGLLDLGFLDVAFSSEVPPGNGHRYTVPLTLVDFPQVGQRHPTDPLPIWAPLPAADVTLHHGPRQVHSRFLVDTGAQLSVISSAAAFALGLDANGNGSFEEEKMYDLPVGGVGGEVIAPILAVDALAVGTDDNVDLLWTDLAVAVLDIDSSIAGVLGMELLTSGWFGRLLGGENGYIDRVHFDFRQADQMTGAMLLDINPTLDIMTYVPRLGDMDLDEDVDFDDIPGFVLGLTNPSAYLNQYGMSAALHGDLDQSGSFDFDDIQPFVALLSAGGSARAGVQPVPEPAPLWLLTAGLAMLWLHGRI